MRRPVIVLGLMAVGTVWAQTTDPASAAIRQYCVGCHNATVKAGGQVFDATFPSKPAEHAEVLEKMVRQLRNKTMPPVGSPRPDAATYDKVASYLENELDALAVAKPNPGDVPPLHRLTRTEYQNSIRDLLGLDDLPKEMDFTLLLPADNAASGFDNLSDLLFISPANMERYLDAATKISRLAVGDPQIPVMVNVHRTAFQGPQGSRVEDLPLGTRGGLAVKSYFPLDAEYVLQLEMAGAARDQHQLEISVDGERRELVTLGGGGGGRGGRGGRGGGAPSEIRVKVTAGPHLLGITFVQKTEALDEATLAPRPRTRGTQPAVAAVTIRGPYNTTGPGTTPSRERVFTCRPKPGDDASDMVCARRILNSLLTRAYRRPVNDADIAAILPFYDAGRKERDFDLGIETAIERILVSPQFLYRVERDPAGSKPGEAHNLSDLELASRLSFFLWSSGPDEELINVAGMGRLRNPGALEQQVKRMLADRRSDSLVTNFAAQWLYLRDVSTKSPDLFVFRDFEENLRAAMQRETELFLGSVLRDNKPVSELLTANYTFLNERLAKHYGIPNIRGSEFRRVEMTPDTHRGGLLGQASVLMLTSYSTRTSPVLRGKYILENLLASPPPPPPPNVPSLNTENKQSGEALSLREAMQIHRQAPACANCHARMDPIGFAMENFDAVGRWRDHDLGKTLDVSSTMTDGTVVNGIDGVKKLVLANPERFAGAVTEKLLMYALARNTQYFDAPAVRKILRDSAKGGYKFSDLVLGVAQSAPFQMRAAAAKTAAASLASK